MYVLVCGRVRVYVKHLQTTQSDSIALWTWQETHHNLPSKFVLVNAFISKYVCI